MAGGDAPLLIQGVRFFLIKLFEDTPPTESTDVWGYFFDPSAPRHISNKPWGLIVYPYPAAPLKVVIVGGGPTGLVAAITLAEKAGRNIEVHVYERRCEENAGTLFFTYHSVHARRRDQVVTLQDGVTELLSKRTQLRLFQDDQERVWPGSSNLQTEKIEDRLLNRAQDTEFKGIIHIHAKFMTTELLKEHGDFHLLLGADGTRSFVQKEYFGAEERKYGWILVLNVGIDRRQPLLRSQHLDMALTLAQTRYQLNASYKDGKACLNMHLTSAEWEKIRRVDGVHCNIETPGYLRTQNRLPQDFTPYKVFEPSLDSNNELWIAILDGLKLYGLEEGDVTSISRVLIKVRGMDKVVKSLPRSEFKLLRRPNYQVSLAGDAALTHHFWPGRGMNSGIKSAVAWADEVVQSLEENRLVYLRPEALKAYEDFLNKLAERENDHISTGIPEKLADMLEKAKSPPDGDDAMDRMIYKTKNAWDLLESRGVGDPMSLLSERGVKQILSQVSPLTLRQMDLTGEWPPMLGDEVRPPRCLNNLDRD
ncbi:hypothetical protein F5B20DRAFT_590335 [Whalleya microplaca]|nr:hypothetical protein F5B20DRAFT_590335 [Whalleya microplaca]